MTNMITHDIVRKFEESEKEYHDLKNKLIEHIVYICNLFGSRYAWKYVEGLGGKLYDIRYTYDWRLFFNSKYGEWYIEDISFSSFNNEDFINVHFNSAEGYEDWVIFPILIKYLYMGDDELVSEFKKIVENLDIYLKSIKEKEASKRENAENTAKEARKKLYLELKEEFEG